MPPFGCFIHRADDIPETTAGIISIPKQLCFRLRNEQRMGCDPSWQFQEEPDFVWVFKKGIHKSPSVLALGRLALAGEGASDPVFWLSSWSSSAIMNASNCFGIGALPLDSSFKKLSFRYVIFCCRR